MLSTWRRRIPSMFVTFTVDARLFTITKSTMVLSSAVSYCTAQSQKESVTSNFGEGRVRRTLPIARRHSSASASGVAGAALMFMELIPDFCTSGASPLQHAEPDSPHRTQLHAWTRNSMPQGQWLEASGRKVPESSVGRRAQDAVGRRAAVKRQGTASQAQNTRQPQEGRGGAAKGRLEQRWKHSALCPAPAHQRAVRALSAGGAVECRWTNPRP